LYNAAGFARIYVNNQIVRIDQLGDTFNEDFSLVVDRVVVQQDDEDFTNRLSSAVDNAFYEGQGQCEVIHLEDEAKAVFNDKFEKEGVRKRGPPGPAIAPSFGNVIPFYP
jgi:excinuclease ABC subunit A